MDSGYTSLLMERAKEWKKRSRRCLLLSIVIHALAAFLASMLITLPQYEPELRQVPMLVELRPQLPSIIPVRRPTVSLELPDDKPESKVEEPPPENQPPKKPKPISEPLPIDELKPRDELLAKKPEAAPAISPDDLDSKPKKGDIPAKPAPAVNYTSIEPGDMDGWGNKPSSGAEPITISELRGNERSSATGAGNPVTEIQNPQSHKPEFFKDLTMPVFLNRNEVHPKHPQISGITKATVILDLWVELNGKPGDIRLFKIETEPPRPYSEVKAFVKAAIEAAKQFRFKPARKGNEKMRVLVRIPIAFDLERGDTQ
jgi:outer membrane biosynthesis protein TonB